MKPAVSICIEISIFENKAFPIWGFINLAHIHSRLFPIISFCNMMGNTTC